MYFKEYIIAFTNILFIVFHLLIVPFHSAALQDSSTGTAEEELYQQCKLAYTKGDFASAGQYIKKYLAAYPESPHADEVFFMQAFIQPSIETSIEGYKSIIEKYPNSKWIAKSLFQLGQCYYLQDKYDKALDYYGSIIVSYPEDYVYWQARYWRCRSFMAKGDYEQAITALRSLEGTGSKEVGRDLILMSLGDCYMEMGDYENAKAAYASLIESMSGSHWVPSAYLLLAKSFQNMGKTDEAKVLLQKLTESYRGSLDSQQAQQILSLRPSDQPKRIKEPQPATPKTPEATVTPSKQETPYFSIQVGAFSSKSSADYLAVQLREKGHYVNVLQTSSSKGVLYKVRVGKFKTREEALKTARTLSEKEKLPADVIQ